MSPCREPRPKRLLVIVPAFNEQGVVARTVSEIRAHVAHAGVLVVDDGSSDQTSAQAALAGASIARLPFNLGVGGAMRLGYRYAVENDYDIAVQVDADGQHDPAFISRLIEPLEDGYDVVIGARFAGEGDYQMTGPRRLASSLLATVLSRICRTALTDPTSGFRATSRRACEIFAQDYPVEYLGDTVEALALAVRHDLLITQVPVAMRQRVSGYPSHSPAKAAVYLARSCVALSIALLRR
jgi:glycosyltransferase involved in cell wall biosynthesis